MKVKLTPEQLETLSYDDVAFIILESSGKKMKIQDLFKKVIKAMELPESEFENGIGDFFELLLTDKRFIMLENGFWDLKINHSQKIVFDDDDDEDVELVETTEEADKESEETDVTYDDDTVETDDAEDELEDLFILDENDDSEGL